MSQDCDTPSVPLSIESQQASGSSTISALESHGHGSLPDVDVSESDAFKPLIPPEAYIVGPAFPEPFPFGILPPVCGKIANNRRVPKYSLGWVLSEDDFLDKYDPEDKYSDVINAWSAELDNEWMGNYPEELKLICYDLGWLSRYLIRIATNKDVVAIERSKDRSLVARGKQVLGINEDPVWYKMP